jgi:hypothetical protein
VSMLKNAIEIYQVERNETPVDRETYTIRFHKKCFLIIAGTRYIVEKE